MHEDTPYNRSKRVHRLKLPRTHRGQGRDPFMMAISWYAGSMDLYICTSETNASFKAWFSDVGSGTLTIIIRSSFSPDCRQDVKKNIRYHTLKENCPINTVYSLPLFAVAQFTVFTVIWFTAFTVI